MSRRYRLGPGAALLTLLAVVLGMSALGVLTLMNARNDEVLSERAARVAESVALLDAQAEWTLAELDAALAAAQDGRSEEEYWEAVAATLPGGMEFEEKTKVVCWIEKNDDGRYLVCSVKLALPGEFPRADWVEHRLVTELSASAME